MFRGSATLRGQVVGAVQIFYGTPGGLTRTGSQIFQASQFLIPVSGPDLTVVFRENMSLVWGDFDGNMIGDLAIEGAAQSTSCDVGVVLLLGAQGVPLSTSRKQEFFVRGGCRPNTVFNDAALAAGDLSGDGNKDLAVGAPGEDVGNSPTTTGISNAGAVSIFNGGGSGSATLSFARKLTQSSPGIEAADVFGASLAANNFNGDLFTDLAIGAPGETLAGQAVQVRSA
ncbi:hypothetical protein BH18ACI5_BH18ACI5_06820 [soil metagenome]